MPGINDDEINAEAKPLLCLPNPTVPVTPTRAQAMATDLDQLLVETFGSPEVIQAWMITPNAVLAGETPGQYLERGDEVAVRKLLLMASTGMPT